MWRRADVKNGLAMLPALADLTLHLRAPPDGKRCPDDVWCCRGLTRLHLDARGAGAAGRVFVGGSHGFAGCIL